VVTAIPGPEAYHNLHRGVRRKTFRLPTKSETGQFRDGGIFPPLSPRFFLRPGETVFTIGSCFARNVENVLVRFGLDVPVTKFQLPAGEMDHPAPHLLNEYNAGTILQRLESVIGKFTYGDDMGIEETPKGFVDLFLHIAVLPIGRERLLERRREIAALYRKLLTSETIILTLGLVECWYDTKYDCYLNKAPSRQLTLAHPGRFSFHRLEVEDVIARMRRSIELLNQIGRKNILLTVSPVPVEATFTTDHALVANCFSKAVLRVACDRLVREFDNVDYYPSYEIITSFGSQAFVDDNFHVRWELIEAVTQHMIDAYGRSPKQTVEEQPLSPTELYQHFFRVLYEESDLDRARGIAERLLADHPGVWFGHDTMGHCHSAVGNLRDALDSANAALALDPHHWALLGRLGSLHEELGDLVRAEDYLRTAAAQPGGEAAQDWLDAFVERHKASIGQA
jgi:tetratricopeptide (TPR) repeat protein